MLSGRIDQKNAILEKDRILSGTHNKINNLQARPPEMQQQQQQEQEQTEAETEKVGKEKREGGREKGKGEREWEKRS